DNAGAIVLSNDIRANQEKILLHGKRADSIVKGMLMHSRASAGMKEPTNINHLADENLRLAYHGLRAKGKYCTPGYWQGIAEFIQQRLLCGNRKRITGGSGLCTNC